MIIKSSWIVTFELFPNMQPSAGIIIIKIKIKLHARDSASDSCATRTDAHATFLKVQGQVASCLGVSNSSV